MATIGSAPLRELVDARRAEIKAIVTRHHGRSVSLVGSVARGDEGPHSDIDFLVDFEPDARPFTLLALGAELEEVLGVEVDIGTSESLGEDIRDEVLAETFRL